MKRNLVRLSLLFFVLGITAHADDELKPDNAYGAAGIVLPREAKQVPEVEFRRLMTGKTLHLTNKKIVDQHHLKQRQVSQNDEAFVKQQLANHPEILNRLMRRPSPNDPNVKPTGDGNYRIRIVDTQGKVHEFVTMGDEFVFGSVANSLRKFPGAKNQHEFYRALHGSLPERYKTLKQLPKPETLANHTPAQLLALNESIAKDLQVILPYLPHEVLPLGYPASCAAEIGYDVRNTDRTGATCAHNANGLYVKTGYPLKYYATCVKNQGNRGTCVSFGVTAAVESKIAVKQKKWMNLSEEDLYNKAKMTWYPSVFGDGLNTAGIVTDIESRNYVFPYESSWNYNPSPSRITDNIAHTYTHSCDGYTGLYCSNTNHQGELVCSTINILGHGYTFCGYRAPVAGTSARQATVVSQVWNPMNPTLSTSLLALAVILKIPATIALPVTPSFDGASAAGFMGYLGTGEGNRGWHAVEVLGYLSNSALPTGVPHGAGGGWFVIKNSWGGCWKDAGYLYLPFDWVKNYVGSASLINDVG